MKARQVLYLSKKYIVIGATFQELYAILRFLIFELRGQRFFADTV